MGKRGEVTKYPFKKLPLDFTKQLDIKWKGDK